jgi:hypothetical protein
MACTSNPVCPGRSPVRCGGALHGLLIARFFEEKK